MSTAEDVISTCKGTTLPVVGECFRFRGRMGLYNGGHSFWIWRVGTNHRYWIEGELPETLNEQNLDFDHFYWANFDACPTTKFKEGYAQGVCLKSADELMTTKKKD